MVNDQDTERDLSHALKTHAAKAAEYRMYINYYEGVHRMNFASTKWRNTFGNLFRQFADNLCAPIIDAAADRLHISHFDSTDDALEQLTRDIWLRNRMERKAGTIHEHALKSGDAYVIVWPDSAGLPTISPNPAHQVCCYYEDDSDVIQYATKLWQIQSGQWRMNVYYPNSIEKYQTISDIKGMPTKASAFSRMPVPGEIWPLPNPYGIVPVFHFANKPEMGVWGESELWNIVPLQDALNKSIADMLVAMEYVALPQRWATGMEMPEDEQGKPIVPFESGVDRIWSAPEAESRFGQFEQANLIQFTQVQNDLRLEMARISRTPLHYLSLGGNSGSSFVSSLYPSGESLKTAEAPFIAKLRDRQISYGDTWEDLMAFCLTILSNNKVDPQDITTVWDSPAPVSITDDLANAIQKLQLGMPYEQIWKELGYSDGEVAKMSGLLDARQTPEGAVTKGISRPAPVQAERTAQPTERTQQ